MKKRKTGWLLLGILSTIIASWFLLTIAGVLFFTLFLYFFVGQGTIDGNHFSWSGLSPEAIIILGITVASTASAIFSFRKYKK